MPGALIELFEVPPESDEAFLAEWRAARAGATLYRALRDDVPLRFVGIAPDAGAYELVHEDGAVDEPGGVTLITPYEVDPSDDERFVAAWDRLRRVLATQRGHLGARLHRDSAATEFRFIEIGRWSSPLMRHRALQRPDVQEAALPFRSHPALYERLAAPATP